MKRLTLIKIGGELFSEGRFEETVAALTGCGKGTLLVHGGGPQASDLSRRLGLDPEIVDGRRVTDAAMLEVIAMTFAGSLNKRIVAALQGYRINAVGLTGIDGNLITADRRVDPERDWGYVGDPRVDGIDTHLLLTLLNNEFMPVVAPLTHDGAGTILNTNADTVAASLAVALARSADVELLMVMDAPGVLASAEDPASGVERLDKDRLKELRDRGVLSGGILPKITASLIAAPYCRVRLGNLQMLSDPTAGTVVVTGGDQ